MNKPYNHMHTRQELEDKLREANNAYYNDIPILDDEEYDRLWREHHRDRTANPDDPIWASTILDRVGASPRSNSGFEKVQHYSPMLSLDNAYVKEGDTEEVKDWFLKVNSEQSCVVIAEPKIDGLSLRVTYTQGKLTRAVTRGNGLEGDDVTNNAFVAGILPIRLGDNADAELNGEVFMTFEAFRIVNAKLEENGEQPYANPRNAAAGIIRRKDPRTVRDMGLSFLVHGVERYSTLRRPKGYKAVLQILASQGVGVVPGWEFYPTGDAQADEATLRSFATQAYPTDGVVLKVDDFEQRLELGETSRAPRWAIAVKLEQETATTLLEGITVQVGRSGVLTPVAELKPVQLDGTTVSRATLHNEDHVNRLQLKVGDTVVIRKAGAIIPEIVRSVSTQHRENFKFDLREHVGGKCPSCGSSDIDCEREDGETTVYVCQLSDTCPAQVSAQLQHAASRDCLNLPNLGPAVCDEIARRVLNVSAKLTPFGAHSFHPFDILTSPEEWLASISWKTEAGGNMTFGKSRAKAFVQKGVIAAKKLPLSRWIAALGLPRVGKNASKEVSRLCVDTHELMRHCLDGGLIETMFRSIHDEPQQTRYKKLKQDFKLNSSFGAATISELYNFARTSHGSYILCKIPSEVVSDNYDPRRLSASGNLSGKSFAITGTLSVPRSEIQKLIESAGGKVTGSVSPKLYALVVGEDAGSKLTSAQNLGVNVWSEEDLMQAIKC